jgi:23S rRNA (cytosine1962-C5)-methyltransferase
MRRRETFESNLEHTDAFRLVHGTADSADGWIIDNLGPVANIRVNPDYGADNDDIVQVARALCESTFPPCKSAWVTIDEPRKDTTRSHGELENAVNAELKNLNLFPESEEWEVLENDRKYLVRCDAGFSYGLFLDMRPIRRELANRWSDWKIANLFAYTCGFGVALSGDNEVWNVDVSKPYLDWGERNYGINQGLRPGKFYRKDAFEFLEFAVERGFTYDAIILDPPVFSHGKKGLSRRFQIDDALEELVELGLQALSEDGELFVSTNMESLSRREFLRRVTKTAERLGFNHLKSWAPGPDYPVDVEEFHLKSALLGR